MFEKDVTVGVNPSTGIDFSFPKRSVVTFDYGVKEGTYKSFIEEFGNPQVVCELNDTEYVNLVYAMYKSPYTKARYKEVLDKILQAYYSDSK